MHELSVSVVIPAYRAAHTICRAVDSILAQTSPAHEILVVDDGSPDDIAAAIRHYGDKVRYLRKSNGGAASARNFGIEAATGAVLAFLDADDYWESQKLARQWEILQKHPHVGIVSSRFYEQPPGGERGLVPRPLIPLDEVLEWRGERAFKLGYNTWTGTVVIRRSVLGDQRFQCGLEPAEDCDLWIRIASSTAGYMIADPLATAVLEPGSLSRTNVDRDLSNMLRVVHRNQGLLNAVELRQWESLIYERWAGCLLSQGSYRKAFGMARERLRRQPLRPVAWWIAAKSALLSVCRAGGRPAC
jgi:glycosyltransferase involved in cell wall biosynthesis